jgi:hypothetical protein
MTTTDTASKFRYQGNGSTDTFAFSGRVFSTSDIVVEIVTRATDALVETLTESTHYTVTSAIDGTASVQVTSAPKIPSSTQDIILRRAVPQSQSLSLPTGTPFPAKNVETALDKVTALVQDLEEVVNRSIKLPAQTSATAGISANPEDDKILAWDGTSGQLKNGPTTASFVDATNTAVAAADTATTQAGIATTQAGLATTAATSAGLEADYAEEWAINPEDDPVSVAAGGDDSTTYSALHWAAKAAASAGGGVKVSSDDTTADYLDSKIVAGAGIIKTTNNSGANETLEIEVDFTDFGSAAFEDAGTAIGDMVQLVDVGGSPALPAVDGSNLTGISSALTYESTEQTITAAGSLTLAHSLGAIPFTCQVWLSCQTGEHGYTAGDKVCVPFVDSSASAGGIGVSVVPDATNLNIRYGSGSGGNVFLGINKTTGAVVIFTNANWKAIFKAVKF